MKNVAFGNMTNVSFQEKQEETIEDKSLHTQSKFFVLHQNQVWGGGGGEHLKGMRILQEEQSCTHCQMFF